MIITDSWNVWSELIASWHDYTAIIIVINLATIFYKVCEVNDTEHSSPVKKYQKHLDYSCADHHLCQRHHHQNYEKKKCHKHPTGYPLRDDPPPDDSTCVLF